jgi:lipoate-protein ligase A
MTSLVTNSAEENTKYRKRRGKLVEIPPEWVGNVTTKATIRQRTSKLPRTVKRALTESVYKYKLRNAPEPEEFEHD